VELSGAALYARRHPVVEFKLDHEIGAGRGGGEKRKVKAEISAVAFQRRRTWFRRGTWAPRQGLEGFLSARTSARRSWCCTLPTSNSAKEHEMPPRRGFKGKGKKGKFGKEQEGQRAAGALPPPQVLPLYRREDGVIDYKDVELLKDFVNETGKIIPARITGPRPATSASSPTRSSARASSRCCRTPTCTKLGIRQRHASHSHGEGRQPR